jgi:thioredoxin-related protein
VKRIIFILFLSLSSLVVKAQEGLTWHTDLSKASELSIKEKKPLMLFFTGSDWCGWCIRLQKEVFKTDEFTKWAKENVILVELDFPKRTPQDEATRLQNFNLQKNISS